ncbi:MAG: hypothetical protein KDE53_34380, partial [Caldilineaceae bacterium]|nr:hypothetical protein [Caldilineaceae bacterium]
MRTQQSFARLLWALLFSLSLTGAPGIAQAQTEENEPAISFDLLSNLTYHSEYSAQGQVTLENGQYEEDDPAVDGDGLLVTLTGYVAYGDLNGDDVEDAAVVLESNTAGTGVFYELAVVTDEAGMLANVASILLGDRVDINDVAIVDEQIVVALLTQGPDDAQCCPTLAVEDIFALEDGILVLVEEEALL